MSKYNNQDIFLFDDYNEQAPIEEELDEDYAWHKMREIADPIRDKWHEIMRKDRSEWENDPKALEAEDWRNDFIRWFRAGQPNYWRKPERLRVFKFWALFAGEYGPIYGIDNPYESKVVGVDWNVNNRS